MMGTLDIQKVASRCQLLQGLAPAEYEAVIAAGRMQEVTAGAYFFHQGDDSLMMYVLVTGRAKLTQVTPDGHQVIVNYFSPGAGLGIIVSLSDMAYPLSAEALEPCTVLAWDRDTMLQLMLRFPRLALNGMSMIGQRFAQLQARFQEVATQRVEQRVARTLLRLVRQFGRRVDAGVLIDMPLSREDLAQMSGTNLYQVSRILSKWEQASIVETGRLRVVLVSAHELVAIAEDLGAPSE